MCELDPKCMGAPLELTTNAIERPPGRPRWGQSM